MLFIFDEVMIFCFVFYGLGFELGLKFDLVIMGKYFGGGLVFGVFGGREEVMVVYDF